MPWQGTLIWLGEAAIVCVMLYIFARAILDRTGWNMPSLDDIKGWF